MTDPENTNRPSRPDEMTEALCIHCRRTFSMEDITAHILVCDHNPVVKENRELKALLAKVARLAANGVQI